KGYGTDTFGKGASTSNSSKPSANTNSLGLVDYMVSKKMDSSFSNRAKLAAKYGIKGYKGTASQNTTLLAKLKAGKPHTPASSSKNTYYTENPRKVKTLVQCDLYNSVDFTTKNKTGGTYPVGTIFTITGMAKTKGGTPRL
ncbi:M15 family peptidase, partial [Listeria monocytogenes]